MENKLHRLIFLTVVFFFAVGVQAQKRNARYVEYINKYSDLAVEQMKLHKIPASITLAQGLLESGAGYSQLARKSNNHFGIKCGGSWRGRTVRHDDDARNECFRAYKHPRDSYEDHSDFLRRGARYAFLFKLDITDYKGWARGLKKAGYATDPSYANRLITIIEDYDLYKYDRKGVYSERKLKKNPWLMSPHQVYIANDIAQMIGLNGRGVGKGTSQTQQKSSHGQQRNGEHKRAPHSLQYAENLVFHYKSPPKNVLYLYAEIITQVPVAMKSSVFQRDSLIFFR